MPEEETKAPLEGGAEEPAEVRDGPKEAPSEPLATTKTAGETKAADATAMDADEILGKFPESLPLGAVLTIDVETRPAEDDDGDDGDDTPPKSGGTKADASDAPVYSKYILIGIGDGPVAYTLGGNAVALTTDESSESPVSVGEYTDFVGDLVSRIAEGDGFVTDCGYGMPYRERPNMHMSAVLYDGGR